MFRALLCSSSGGKNCIIQHLVSSHPVGGTNSCFIISLLYASTCFEHIVVHCTHSNGTCNAGWLTAVSQPALHIPVYSEKPLMMDTGTARNI